MFVQRFGQRAIQVLAIALVAYFPASSCVLAQVNHASAIENYLTDDVVGVFYLDLEKLDWEATVTAASALGFELEDEFANLGVELDATKMLVEKLKSNGVNQLYSLIRAESLGSQRSSWVIPLKAGSDPVAASAICKAFLAKAIPEWPLADKLTSQDGFILAASSEEQLEALKINRPKSKRELREMWKELGNGSIGLVLFGNDDSRKIIRELMPSLPTPFENVSGETLANVEWAGLAALLQGKTDFVVKASAADETTAKKIEASLLALNEVLEQSPQSKEYIPAAEMGFVFGSLVPSRSGNQIEISGKQLAKEQGRLSKALGLQVKAARARAVSNSRLKQLRTFAIAMHNYESAHTHFPAQGSFDDNGKALLSWRVHILPFISEKAAQLHAEFNLDQPWDSDHNIKLVEKMPRIYWDPNPDSLENNQAGKTIFQVPAGNGMMFNGNQETKFGDMHDGSSNILLMATLSSKHAIEWSKPVDWQVDLENPKAMLRDGRTSIDVAIADGSTYRVPLATPDKTWSYLLQHQDGNIVSGSDFEQ
jgi:hypothetical protein